MQGRPGDDERHHQGLAGAGGELERVAQQVAGLRHLAAALRLVQVDDRLDRLLLAEEEPLRDRLALLVAFEPPLEEAPRDHRRAGVALPAPVAYLVSQAVDKIVHLLALDEQILEERCLPAYNGRDTAAYISSRGQEPD